VTDTYSIHSISGTFTDDDLNFALAKRKGEEGKGDSFSSHFWFLPSPF
jgi:hypothetical protein